ncbi:hypothetical protein Avbf_15054 [Armadillidium vulgare]|nr:hypothetical protein Avbf_15054 [Armadillidium vulgare]
MLYALSNPNLWTYLYRNLRLFQKRMTTIPFFRTHILTSGETFPNLHYDHILEQSKYYKMVKSANLFRPEISF